MSDLEPVDGHGVVAAVDIQDKVLVTHLDDAEWARVWPRKGPPVTVLANIDPSRAGEVGWHLRWTAPVAHWRWRNGVAHELLQAFEERRCRD